MNAGSPPVIAGALSWPGGLRCGRGGVLSSAPPSASNQYQHPPPPSGHWSSVFLRLFSRHHHSLVYPTSPFFFKKHLGVRTSGFIPRSRKLSRRPDWYLSRRRWRLDRANRSIHRRPSHPTALRRRRKAIRLNQAAVLVGMGRA